VLFRSASDGTVYVGSGDYLYALNPDGTLKWRYQTGYEVQSSPAIASDGTIYVGSGDYLYALNPDGTLKWRHQTGGSVRSPAIASDGTIYVGSDDGYLHAIQGTSPLAVTPWPKFHHDNKNSGRVGGP
jgi:outer membrane protein assembly factor BamB